MGKWLWFIFFLIPVSLFAQVFPVDAASGKIYYSEEVLVKDSPRSDLYFRAKSWFKSSSKNKQVLPVDDAVNGLIIGSNYSLLLVNDGHKHEPLRLWYTLKIEMEDDRYWYSLSDFKIQKETLAVTADKIDLKEPLESMIYLKNKEKAENKPELSPEGLADAAHQCILDLIKNLKTSML